MVKLEAHFQVNVDNVQRIPIVNEMLEIICKTTGMGFAAVARVTSERWITCAVHDKLNFGLVPGGELKVETTLCHEIRQHHQVIVFDNVEDEPQYVNHHTPKLYGLKSYISVPLFLKNGEFFGTLCAIDPNPAKIRNKETIGMFRLYADLLAFHLDAVDQIQHSEAQLKEEKDIAELREQFIAILGHDLRNPVGAVYNVAQIMLRMQPDERIQRLAHILQSSSLRMREMIENILDFARGRLGEGIVLDLKKQCIAEQLDIIIVELQMAWPGNKIIKDFDLSHETALDPQRIAQLFSNLLSNALHHGNKEQPVTVTARTDSNGFQLSVTNKGEPIPENLLSSLFKPFSRGSIKPGQQGLGLGLFIASEIARAHKGTLTVRSDKTSTTFLLKIPAVNN